MSEGLEALHHPRIKSAQVDISAEGKRGIGFMFFDDTKQYTTIEKELKRLEQLEIMYSNCVVEAAKQEEALEIIKNKKVDIKDIYRYEDYSQYHFSMLGLSCNFRLTKEEYDLLREILQ